MNFNNFLANPLRVASGLPVEPSPVEPPPVEPEPSNPGAPEFWHVPVELGSKVYDLIDFYINEIAPLLSLDKDHPNFSPFCARIIRNLYEEHGPDTLNQLERLKAEYEKFTPQIQKLVHLVSGGKDPQGFFEARARAYIFHSSNDPQTSIDLLMDVANILERAVKATFNTNTNLRLYRNIPKHEKKNFLKDMAEVDLVFKKNVWALPVEKMRPSIRRQLEELFDSEAVTFSESKRIKQVLQRVFQEYEAPVSKSKPKKIKPASPVFSAQPLTNGAAHSSDVARAHEKLDELLIEEQVKNERYVDEIQAHAAQLPALQSTLEEKLKNLTAASDIKIDLGQKLFLLLRDTKAPLVKKLSELTGQEVTGYETPDSIATLASPGDEVVFQVSASEINRQDSAHPVKKEIKVRHFDVDAIIKGFDDSSLLQKAKHILNLRTSNTTLDFESEKIALTCLQLERRIAALELKAAKLVERSVLIETAIADVQDEINDIQDEINEAQAAPLRDAVPVSPYPPLSQLEAWVNENLQGRVRVHRFAFNIAADPTLNHRHPEWIYEGLKLLANEYWDQITSGDYDPETAQNLRAAFKSKADSLRMKIGGSVTKVTSRGENQYFATFDGKRLFMDQHLARGTSRDPSNHMRIYFTWDEKNRTVLVGHLPTHLSNSLT